MEALNRSLYLAINAPDHPAALVVAAAAIFGEYAIWIVPAMVGLGWLRGDTSTRKILLEATASALSGLFANQLIALVWQHPRPFMIGLGNTLIPHVADSSFPSDHLTLLWAVAFSLLMQGRSRRVGLALALLGIPMAWARIYLGVHFPLDMAGAALVALLSAGGAHWAAPWFVTPACNAANRVHRCLFAPLIRRGWVQK